MLVWAKGLDLLNAYKSFFLGSIKEKITVPEETINWHLYIQDSRPPSQTVKNIEIKKSACYYYSFQIPFG